MQQIGSMAPGWRRLEDIREAWYANRLSRQGNSPPAGASPSDVALCALRRGPMKCLRIAMGEVSNYQESSSATPWGSLTEPNRSIASFVNPFVGCGQASDASSRFAKFLRPSLKQGQDRHRVPTVIRLQCLQNVSHSRKF